MIEDAVWSYPDPVSECPKIRDYLCFFNERVDAIVVDGQELAKPSADHPVVLTIRFTVTPQVVMLHNSGGG